MAEVNPQVMDLVQAEIKKNKDVSNKELFEKATAIDKSIGKLSARQFNARYPLQVKRGMAPKRKPSRKGAAGQKAAAGGRRQRSKAAGAARGQGSGQKHQDAGRGRDQIRTVMLELAREVANAPGKGDVIDVVAGIDRYVDRIIKATR